MTTNLIVLTSLDELRAKKESLVQKFGDSGNLKKYGDDSVETNDDQVFFLRVITLNDYRTKLFQEIGRGYSNADLSSVIREVKGLLDKISDPEEISLPATTPTGEITEKDRLINEKLEQERQEDFKTDEELLNDRL